MAVELRHVTRELLSQWLDDWKALPEKDRPSQQDYIVDQLEKIEPGLSTRLVDTSQRDDYPDAGTPLIRLIMDDIHTYADTSSPDTDS